jgi:AraC-like DNA-binding protein/uncharacterized RmlC-like cupin family protein
MPFTIRKKEGFAGQQAIIIPRPVLAQACSRNDILNTLYITDMGYYPKAKYHYRERPHGADQHILIYCHEGRGAVRMNKTAFAVQAGDFFIIPTKTPHMYQADATLPWTIYWIHFKGKTAPAILSFLKKRSNGYKGFIQHADKSIGLFNDMYKQLEKGYGTDQLVYCNMCLWHYLTLFIFNEKQVVADKSPQKDMIDKAIDYLRSHIDQEVTLEAIAQSVNISPSHFSYLFKNKTGFSPIEYFNHLKVQEACQYLLFTDMRIREISSELGIYDPYYFSRMFKKVMGLSPQEYRKKRIH